jgi:hypothetical protein
VPYVVERIVQQGAEANKGRVFIPTGQPCTTLHLFLTHRCARFPVEGVDSFLRLRPWRCRSIPYDRRDAGWC